MCFRCRQPCSLSSCSPGFNRPLQWRNLYLFSYPILFLILPSFLGGLRIPARGTLGLMVLSTLVTAFSEEAIYRGVVLHALLATGVMRAVFATSLLFGLLHISKVILGASLLEVLPITVAATTARIGYAALRLRTGSIWPIILFRFAFNLVSNITTPETIPSLIAFLSIAVSVGFLAYGLFLLREGWMPITQQRFRRP